MSDTTSNGGAGVSPEVGQPAAPVVNWDDSDMSSTYCNVVNASSTREEVMLFFGQNETWNPGDDKQFDVKLLHRILLNPIAAKRLFVLLGAVLAQYEKRFGTLDVDGLKAAAEALKSDAAKRGKSG
ncbi:MAG: DUF3467 domain-containing protein [Pseudomonadota bacterium]